MNSVSSKWLTNFHVHTGETIERPFCRLLARLDGGIRGTRMVGPAEQGRPLGPAHPAHQDLDEVSVRPALLDIRGVIPLGRDPLLSSRLDMVNWPAVDWGMRPTRKVRTHSAVVHRLAGEPHHIVVVCRCGWAKRYGPRAGMDAVSRD